LLAGNPRIAVGCPGWRPGRPAPAGGQARRLFRFGPKAPAGAVPS